MQHCHFPIRVVYLALCATGTPCWPAILAQASARSPLPHVGPASPVAAVLIFSGESVIGEGVETRMKRLALFLALLLAAAVAVGGGATRAALPSAVGAHPPGPAAVGPLE